MFYALDIFFVILHSSLILFNLFGWAIKGWRKVNLITLSLTAFSWFILGIWKGWGYCPLTDWHFEIIRKLGAKNLPNSYIKYLADRITGYNFDANLIDTITLLSFIAALTISIYLNLKNHKSTINQP
ncbi:DUF2784 domain-containing protein [Solitalea lacus]|uniref:DUF2784 domain-containing protein n=1 Tax=Solitalea lacus TaxID=2911172 RepID=UPI001EDBB6AE|nr:DUF2784 domain-containing protein [Solitalea lacus]UKJ09102.1 DUF2784 domain-containing protein [Solitalea lacus]